LVVLAFLLLSLVLGGLNFAFSSAKLKELCSVVKCAFFVFASVFRGACIICHRNIGLSTTFAPFFDVEIKISHLVLRTYREIDAQLYNRYF